jgi:osmotically inducible protein OsmC
LTTVLEFLLAGSRVGRWPRRIERPEARSCAAKFAQPQRGDGRMPEKPDVLYTAEATVTGGRNGHGRTSDGRLEVDLDVPTEMSGAGGPGTNPEQLFAIGYAACFQSSVLRFAAERKLDLSEAPITARVGIGPLKGGGFGHTAALDLDATQITREDAVELMTRSHEACPYSRATRGNIDVTLTVGGTSIERLAA